MRRRMKSPNITAAVANTRGKNTSTAASTKSINMRLMKTRTANASIDINIGNTNAKSAPLPQLPPYLAPPANRKWNLLPRLEIQVWTTGLCWRIWRSRGPWSKLNWTANWWRARFSLAWVWSFRAITLDLKRMEMRGSEMENSIQEAAQVNLYLPEGEKVGNLDGTQQQRSVNPAPSVVVVVNPQISLPRRQSRTRRPKAVRLQVLKTEAVAGADQRTESAQGAPISPRREKSQLLLST